MWISRTVRSRLWVVVRMPDKVYTFQQTLTIQLIEQLAFLLVEPNRSRRQVVEQFRALWAMTMKDQGLPNRLRPVVYFKAKRPMWKDRVMVSAIYEWLVDLHGYYDSLASKVAYR